MMRNFVVVLVVLSQFQLLLNASKGSILEMQEEHNNINNTVAKKVNMSTTVRLAGGRAVGGGRGGGAVGGGASGGGRGSGVVGGGGGARAGGGSGKGASSGGKTKGGGGSKPYRQGAGGLAAARAATSANGHNQAGSSSARAITPTFWFTLSIVSLALGNLLTQC